MTQLIPKECSKAVRNKMRRSILLLLFPAAVLGICPDGYNILYNGKCFRYFDEELTFAQARQKCKDNGAELASIHSAEENSVIYSALQGKTHTWLGLYFNYYSSNWYDGTPYDYQNFDSNVAGPSTNMGVHFLPDEGGRWHWATGNVFPFLCQVQQVPPTGPCELNYSFHEELGLCLRMGDHDTSWNDAESLCQMDNAHLVSIHDQESNSFIRRVALSNNFGKEVLIGLRLFAAENRVAKPFWSDGTTVDYQSFDQGMPNSVFGDCTALETSSILGGWESIECDDSTKFPFICSKKPPCPGITNLFYEGDAYSPDYPSSPSRALSCEYYLAADKGSAIIIEFDEIQLVKDDQIMLYEGESNATVMAIVRGDSVGKRYITQTANILRLVYMTGTTPGIRKWHARFGHF